MFNVFVSTCVVAFRTTHEKNNRRKCDTEKGSSFVPIIKDPQVCCRRLRAYLRSLVEEGGASRSGSVGHSSSQKVGMEGCLRIRFSWFARLSTGKLEGPLVVRIGGCAQREKENDDVPCPKIQGVFLLAHTTISNPN